jgi:hypothetical protein
MTDQTMNVEMVEMVEWRTSARLEDTSIDDADAPDSVPDFGSLYPELELDGFSEDEMEVVNESYAPYNPSHPHHRDYCSGCSSCDRVREDDEMNWLELNETNRSVSVKI